MSLTGSLTWCPEQGTPVPAVESCCGLILVVFAVRRHLSFSTRLPHYVSTLSPLMAAPGWAPGWLLPPHLAQAGEPPQASGRAPGNHGEGGFSDLSMRR